MDRKIRIGAVSYVNTVPMIHGISKRLHESRHELVLDYPARLVERLRSGDIDMGLIPVGAIPTLPGHRVVSDYCIGADGAVASVAVFSMTTPGDIEEVLLDYQSRTSVLLCRILLQRHLGLAVAFTPAQDESYIGLIKGRTAGLVIGDRALGMHARSPYHLDLGSLWKEYTGLPFVFACWVTMKDLPAGFLTDFNEAIRYGVENIDESITGTEFPAYDLSAYLHRNISYVLDDRKRKGMQLFLERASDF